MGRFGVWTLVLMVAIMDFGLGRAGWAQSEVGELVSVPISGASGRSVRTNVFWAAWSWTAPATGAVTFDTAGTGFTTALVVYDGTTVVVSTLRPDDLTPASEALFTARQGRVYSVVATRFDGSLVPGTIVLNWHAASSNDRNAAVSRPDADDFASSTELRGASGRIQGSNVGAGGESGEPNHAGEGGGASVWWTWTAPAAGEATFDTHGSDFDTLLAVYTGANLYGLTAVASNDDTDGLQSEVNFTAEQGQVYHIAVDGYGGRTGAIELNWWLASTDHLSVEPLREQVFDDGDKTVYVIWGDNGSLQYRLDASGKVEQSLFQSAERTQRVRTLYDEATGAPWAVLNEVSGHWLTIRGTAYGRVDFSAYDVLGNYLGGFAMYEKSGQYFTGELDGAPGDVPTVDIEDGLTNVQVVPAEVAAVVHVLRGGRPVATGAPSRRRTEAEAYSLHRGLTKGGLGYVRTGLRLLATPGGQIAGAHLATAGAAAFFAAQFLPDIANGIRTTFGRDCPPAGSFGEQTCAELTNLAADMLSRQGTGPIGYLRDAMDWIKDSPSHLRNWIARGADTLKSVIAGLLPGDTARESASEEPIPSYSTDRTSGTPYVMCAAPISSNVGFGIRVVYEFAGWETSPSYPYVAYHVRRTETNSRGTEVSMRETNARCEKCDRTGTFSTLRGELPCSSFHEFAQSEWDYGHQGPIRTRIFNCLPQWPSYFCGN